MSRIRSIHPGFFTDERLVSVSMAARLLFIGLGVEADDKGVFEWKPLTIKMRVFPGDNVDVEALLAELAGVDAIAFYEIEGRKYGAIRNFRKFQKPKTPNDVHPLPNHFRNYVGLTDVISEPFPQNGEKPLLMEDGGGKREEGKGEKKLTTFASERPKRAQPEIALQAGGVDPLTAKRFAQHCADKRRPLSQAQAESIAKTLRDVGQAGGSPPAALDLAISKGWTSLEIDWLRNAGLKMNAAQSSLQPLAPDQWRVVMAEFDRTGQWNDAAYGPRPGQAGCRVPPELLERAA